MLTAGLTLLGGILIILVVIGLNGYFVAQEFAYMSVDRSKLRALAVDGDVAAERALQVTRRTSFMLSGAQLGITVTGLVVGFVAEPMVGVPLGVLLGGVGVPLAVSISVGTIGALVVSTVIQMVFAELYPKNLAIANPIPLSRTLARSTLIYLAVFGWLIVIFDQAANALLRLVRVEPVHDVDSSADISELERIVADSRESGDLAEDLFILLDRILDFPNQDVGHAMVPRPQVQYLSTEATVGDARAHMALGHTRYPVMNEQGTPVGIVSLHDVLAAGKNRDADPVRVLMRDVVVLPELMPLPQALGVMKRNEAELACVVDEYGDFSGILTVEDLAEEVVGEITDEHDNGVQRALIEATGESAWRMSGTAPLDEVEREIGHDLPEGDYETIAGLAIASAGALPVVGSVIIVDLPDDPADLGRESSKKRHAELVIRRVSHYVPTELEVRLCVEANDAD